MLMLKRISLVMLVLLVIVSAWCRVPAYGASDEVKLITIGSASQTGSSYAIGAAIATLLNNHMEGYQFSNQATAGSVQNVELLRNNEIDFAVITNESVFNALNRLETFEGKPPADFLRTVTYVGTWTQHIMTNDMSIDNVEDFKGTEFAVGGAGSGVEQTFRGSMKALGIDYTDSDYWSAEYMAFGNASEALTNGQIVGAYDNQIVPAAGETTAMASGKLKMISYTEEQIQKIMTDQTYAVRVTIPSGTYPNQNEDIITLGFNNHLMSRANIDEELVYQMCKVIFENINELHVIYDNLSDLTIDTAMTTFLTPPSEGALRYYKEIGVAK